MRKFFCFFFLVLNVLIFLSAQDFDKSFEDELEKILGEDNSSAIDKNLQKEFVFVDGEHEYDLNPHTASYSSESQILGSLYEGLFSYNPSSLEAENALAVSYRISRNKKRWTFTLRENLQWSDGTTLSAKDVEDSWIALLEEKAAPYASLFDCIEGAKEFREGKVSRDAVGIRAMSATKIVLTLQTPAGYLPRILCHSAFAICKKNLNVFSGAYTLSFDAEKNLVLQKNKNYWDYENVHLEKIIVKQSSDADENAFLFNTGNADWISGNTNAQKLLAKNVAQVNAEFASEYLFFKIRDGSIWNDADFRLALLEAVPWDELRNDSLVKAETFVYPINNYPNVEGFSYTDLDEAKELMKNARKKNAIAQNKKLTLIFAIVDSDYMKKMANLLSEAWAPLGVEVQVQTASSDRYLANIESWNADLFSYTWIGDFADALSFLELFRGDASFNASHWKNSEFDNLLLEASNFTDENRSKLLAKAEQLLLDSGMILPISHPVSYNIIDLKKIGGWHPNAFDIHPFKFLYKKNFSESLPNIVKK